MRVSFYQLKKKKNHGKLYYVVKFIKILNKMSKRDTKKNYWKNLKKWEN